MSFRELSNHLDQYANELLSALREFEKSPHESYILEMKRSLVHLEAIVDELHEDIRAKTR